MKKRITAIALSAMLALSFATGALAVGQQEMYTGYYTWLKSAVDTYGLYKDSHKHQFEHTGNAARAVSFARVIDFDKNGAPELLYCYSTGKGCYNFVVLGYANGNVVKLTEQTMSGADSAPDIELSITQDKNRVFYLKTLRNANSIEGTDVYSTVINGKWTAVCEVYEYDTDNKEVYKVNGKTVTERQAEATKDQYEVNDEDVDYDQFGASQVERTLSSLADSGLKASRTASTVYVDGQSVKFDAYNIGGNNYFKLRDIAYTLNGTSRQFDVGWNGAANAITLTAGKAYTAVGGEMSQSAQAAAIPRNTQSKILMSGKDVALTAFNIGNNNYFKLRDIGKTFNFGVTWNPGDNSITIDTDSAYKE